MFKKFFGLFALASVLLLTATCLQAQPDAPAQNQEPSAPEVLEEISFEERMENQMRFSDYVDDIYSARPIGPSGEIIAPEYFGGLLFNDHGILTVQVLARAFDHPPSATAIEEMRERGIIISIVEFTYRDLMAAVNSLNLIHQRATALGATSWGLGALNRVGLQLDPYNDEQLVLFNDFLLANSFDPAMFIIEPAITPEMVTYREQSIATAVRANRNHIVPVGAATVSRTGIAFTLENRTAEEFMYGLPWDLAYYANGQWRPVEFLPGAGASGWHAIGFTLQSGGIQNYRQEWGEWRFGELGPGRYMFIREGWLGQWHEGQERIFALVEFEITPDSPAYLPPQPEEEWPNFVSLVSYGNITPDGMTVRVQNNSRYDIDHRAQIMVLIPEEDVAGANWWDWQWEQLPFLPVEGYWIDHLTQGQGLLPAFGELEFELDWTTVFGPLVPGDYRIVLDVGGWAHAPHPTGWVFGEAIVILFTVE